MWTKYDADRSGSMTLSELRAMLKDLQLNLSEGELRHTLAHYDVDGSGTIEKEEFFDFLSNLPNELEARQTSEPYWKFVAFVHMR